MLDFLELFVQPRNYVNGLTLGLTYAMIAVGYTMVYGIIKLINFAHGEVFMFGAYFGLFATQALEHDGEFPSFVIPIAVVAAMIGCSIVGILLDWTAYLPLREKHRLPGFLSSVGLVLLAALSVYHFMESDRGVQPRPILQGAVAAVALLAFVGALATLLGRFGPPQASVESGRLSALITAIGMSLSFQTLAQLLWTANHQAVAEAAKPRFFNRVVAHLGTNPILGKELVVWGTALLLTAVLTILVQYTRIGKAMRASALDRRTASLMGVNVNHVIAFTFVVGSSMAAVAGILRHLKGGMNIHPQYGYYPGVIAFSAAVLGGIGNIKGALLGGLLIGLVQAFAQSAGLPHYDFAFAFGLMVLVIVFRPWGILGRVEARRA